MNRWGWLLTGIVVLLLLFTAADGMGGYPWRTGHMMGFGGGYWGMGLGLILWLLFLVLIIAGVVFLVRELSSPRRGRTVPGESPLDILKKRYARGELNREEYEAMRRDLEA